MTHTSVQFKNYEVIECLHTGAKTLVYRGQRTSDGESVILKLLRSEYPSFNEILQFRNQYTITKNLQVPGIIRPYCLESYGNSYMLVMKDTGGISLQQYAQNSTVSLTEILTIALQLSEALHQLHQARVIHKDIKPANIIIHPQSKQVWLIDFSIASLLPRETQEIQNPNILEGTIAYISPEQTGRMNRGIDYRSDFYSLGVTLYELITKKLPFESNDLMEMVHFHIAKIPQALETEKEIPEVISNLVLKLMAKNAEDRYQSAWGLKHDLEQCLIQWGKTGNITKFKLGERDLSERFLIPEKLYGREAEVQTLLNAFDRVSGHLSEKQHSEMMLVAGYSGVGKTAVINEVHKPITRSSGYFIKGKFDQFNRNIPFSAFVQAFRSLMEQLLSESDIKLADWKRRILQALGEQGQVLIGVIPELESIIESQPPVQELSGTAAQNRFNILLSKFVQIFTTAYHPLVIFLDDLQWADSASLNLLKLLMSESKMGYLLVLGAYRDNEVFPAHPLMLTLDEITKQGANLNTLTLKPLNETNITQLVADTLLCPTGIAEKLSQLVYQKTKGNPFFTTQFLKGLHEDKWITFDPNGRYWQCDMAQVRQLALTDDVVEFMAGRLQKLPKLTQNILKLAACIGNQFDLSTLAVICELNQDEVAVSLWDALQEGFVLPESETYKFFQEVGQTEQTNQSVLVDYRFLHDRVQQAAYTLIQEDQKQFTHYQIGQLLLHNQSEEKHNELIFDIVNQLNIGQAVISDLAEKYQLARLNQQAGQKAKLSAAYQAAQNYYKIGIDLLPQTAWQTDYELMYELHRECSEAAYLCGNFDQAEALYATTLSQAQTALDQATIYRVQMTQYQLQGRNKEAIGIIAQSLKLLGWEMPKTSETTQAGLDQQIATVSQFLKQSSIDSILKHPQMEDVNIAEMLRILQILFYAAWLDGQPILSLLAIAKMTTLSLEYGNSDMSPFGYVGYGMIANGLLKNAANAYQFGIMAVKLCEQFDNADVQGMTNFLFAADVHSWTRPLREANYYYENAFQYGMEAGNWLTVSFMMIQSGSDRLTYGKNLEELYEITRTHADFLQRIKSLENRDALMAGVLQPIRDLLELTEKPTSFDDNDFSEAEYLEKYRNTPYHLAWLYSVKIRHAYLFSQTDQYLDLIPKLEIIENTVPSHAKVPSSVFYVALMHLSFVTTNDDIQNQFHWQAVIPLEEKLRDWGQNCPENIHHKYLLVQAEKARLQGQSAKAIDFYEQAITHAQIQGYIYEEALANELAAQFYLSWGFNGAQRKGKDKVAAGYLQEAYYCYSRWGAKAKITQLEQQYPKLLTPILQQSREYLDALQTCDSTRTKTHLSTNSGGFHLLDLSSVIKASQVLSGEIEIEKLVNKLMQLILENAGATKSVLILSKEQDLIVKAVATQSSDFSNKQVITQQSTLIEDSSEIPIKLINWMKRKLKIVVVDDIKNNTEWASDKYLFQQQPKSLLCLPLLNNGKLIAILYLENSLITQVFTSERVEVLKLLCSQAAISLENAELYQKSQNYANQLKQSLTQLQEAQLQLVQGEKMSALGQMISGITHEINNPLGFVSGNINQAEEALQNLLNYLEIYQQYHPPGEEVTAYSEEIELDYLLEDFPEIITSMKTGVNRIQEISKSMRIFSRSDQEKMVEFDLHESLDSTLLILKHRLKASDNRPEIKVIKDYGDFSTIQGFPGQLNQVFMNILANAVDIFDEVYQESSIRRENSPQIVLKTSLDSINKTVEIQIKDNGRGMSKETQAKIFDHLFTTKAVGKGTGLGLSIARQIVVDKHGGDLICDSKMGEGTEFIIQIPA